MTPAEALKNAITELKALDSMDSTDPQQANINVQYAQTCALIAVASQLNRVANLTDTLISAIDDHARAGRI